MSTAIEHILRQCTAAVPVEFLFAMAVKGTLILGLAGLAVFLLRRGPAAVRHYIFGLAIVGVGVLPFIAEVVPGWELAPMAPLSPTIEFSRAPAETPNPPVASTVPVDHHLPLNRAAAADVRMPWTAWAALVWCMGAAVMLLRIAVGSAGSWWILYRARPLADSRIARLAGRCKSEIGLRRRVRFLVSPRASIPYTCGLFRARVVLPAAAITWPVERLRLVVLHELAHIQRGDALYSALVRAVSIMYWFNPLYWMAVRGATLERERAVDDRVLAVGAKPHTYAQHLLEIGKTLSRSRCFAPAGVGMAHSSQLGKRIMDIVNVKKTRGALTMGRGILLTVITAAVIIPLAGITGQAADEKLQGVTELEKNEIVSTLINFYDALTDGEDFPFVCEMYLAADYFDRPELTKENLGREKWREAFNNSMAMYSAVGLKKIIGPPAVRSRIESIRREGDRYIVKQKMDLLIPSDQPEGHYVVKSLEHESVFVQENENWKIARFDGGVSVMRMDVENPYGPIFLLWVNNVDPATTPDGPVIFKVIPREYRAEGTTQLAFQLEADNEE